MKPFLLFSPDGASGADPAPPKPPKARGAFNREVAALLSEAADLVVTARDPRFAPILAEYDVTPAEIDALELKIEQAQEKFGLASSGAQAGQAATSHKDELEDDLEDAIRPIQTGARLTYPQSAADQRRYYTGTEIGQDESQLELIATTILRNLQTDTLRGVTPAKIQALQSAYTAWHAAVLAQTATQTTPQQDRAQGEALLKEITPVVIEIKTVGDGAYPYKNPVNHPIRKLFHIPEKRPYVYTPREN